jgi:hypothetical protein
MENKAAGDKDGVTHISSDGGWLGTKAAEKGVEIPMVGIGTMLEGKQNVIIKSDCEGAEEKIFTNDADFSQVYRIMMEYHGEQVKGPIAEALRRKGFEVEVKLKSLAGEGFPVELGYIYASRGKLSHDFTGIKPHPSGNHGAPDRSRV